jgi:WD40 repeat protein
LRPGVAGSPDSDVEPNRVVHRYVPASSWWPKETTNQRGLFIDDIELTKHYALAGGQDPTGTAVVLVWDASSGRPLRRLPLTVSGVNQEQMQTGMPSLVSAVTELPKRHLIVAYSALQELIVLWSTQSWQRVMAIDVGPIDGFAVDPQESTLLVSSLSDKQSELHAGNTHTTLQFIDIGTGKLERTVRSDGATFAGFTERGTLIEAASGGVIRQLSGDGTRRLAPDINVESGDVTSWSLKQKSNVIAVGTKNGDVRLIDLHTGSVSAPLPGIAYTEALAVSFNPDGSLLAEVDGRDEGNSHRLMRPNIWQVSDSALESRACAMAGGPPTRQQWTAWTGLRRSRRPCD